MSIRRIRHIREDRGVGFFACVRYMVCVLLWSCVTMELVAQKGWIQQNISHALYDVQFVNSQTGWAVGEQGTILFTTDGGQSWVPQLSKTRRRLRDLHFLNATLGYAVGEDGQVRRTVNGGTTWDPKWTDVNIELYSVHFFNGGVGWAVGADATVIRTGNGGEDWRTFAAIPLSDVILHDVFFANRSVGWAVGTEGTLLKTTSGGAGWGPVEITPPTTDTDILSDVNFYDLDTGFVVSRAGAIYKTTDQGDTWKALVQQPDGSPFTRTRLNSISIGEDAQILWVTGVDGFLMMTDDGGETWTEQTRSDGSPISDRELHALTFTQDESMGWLVGEGGIVLRSEDAGVTWTETLNSVPIVEHLNAVHFYDRDTGWAVGVDARVIKTTDGGRIWKIKDSRESGDLLDVHFIDARTGWAVGKRAEGSLSRGMVLLTDDGGETWEKKLIRQNTAADLPEERGLNSVFFLNERLGYAVGLKGWKSSDGGTTWVEVPSAPVGIKGDVYFQDAQNGWMTAGSGIYKTVNGGGSWVAQNTPSSVPPGSGNVRALSIGTSAQWGVGGIQASPDDPFEIEEILRGEALRFSSLVGPTRASLGRGLRDVLFVHADRGWVVGQGGLIAQTVNGSARAVSDVLWEQQFSDTERELQGMYFVGADTGWVVGHEGIILHTTRRGEETRPPYLHILPDDDNMKTVENEDGNFMMSVTADRSWTIESDMDWVTFRKPEDNTVLAGAPGNQRLIVFYSSSVSTEARTATLTFRSGELSEVLELTQRTSMLEAVPQFSSGVSATTLPMEAGSFTVVVTTNVNWQVELLDTRTPPMLMSARSDDGMMDSGVSFVSVAYSENLGDESRSAVLRFSTVNMIVQKEVAVTQVSSLMPSLSNLTVVPNGDWPLSEEAGDFTVRLLSNTSWTLSKNPPDVDWLTPALLSGNLDQTLQVDYTENTGVEQREATLVFTAMGGSPVREIRCIQVTSQDDVPSAPPLLAIYPHALPSLSNLEGEQSIRVFSNTSWTVGRSEGVDWVSLSITSGNMDKTVVASYTENLGAQREGSLIFTAMGGTPVLELAFTQLAPDEMPPLNATLTVQPIAMPPLAKEAGERIIRVLSNTGWTVTREGSGNVTWVMLSVEIGSGNGWVRVNYTPNMGAQRGVTLAFRVIGGALMRDLELIQLAVDAPPPPHNPTISLQPNVIQRVSSSQGMRTIEVSSNTSWAVSKSADADWLTLSTDNGYRTETVIVSYERNGAEERSARLLFRAFGSSGLEISQSLEILQLVHENPSGAPTESVSGLRFHPNPVAQTLSVVAVRAGTVQLRALEGPVLFSRAMAAGETYVLDISAYAAGVYLIVLQDAEGSVVRRLILE